MSFKLESVNIYTEFYWLQESIRIQQNSTVNRYKWNKQLHVFLIEGIDTRVVLTCHCHSSAEARWTHNLPVPNDEHQN